MLSAGQARRGDEPRRLLLLPGTLDVERIVACDLDADTAARGVRFLGELTVQVSETIPPGWRAAVVLHFLLSHERQCRAATCPDGRAWLAEAAGAAESVPLVSA